MKTTCLPPAMWMRMMSRGHAALTLPVRHQATFNWLVMRMSRGHAALILPVRYQATLNWLVMIMNSVNEKIESECKVQYNSSFSFGQNGILISLNHSESYSLCYSAGTKGGAWAGEI